MIGRVTHQTIQRSSLANLQVNLSKMADLQAKLSSGTNVQLPSDDPAATSDILALNRESSRITQYQRNAADATTWLNVVDSSLQGSVTSATRARTLMVQAGNGSYSQSQLDAIADELEGVRDTLLEQANTSVNGRTVFAGASDAGEAFTVGTDASGNATYTFTGADAAGVTTPVYRRVGDAATVRVDGDGAAAYGDGTSSIFAVLDDTIRSLRAGTYSASSSLTAIDTSLNKLKAANSVAGARQNQVDNAIELLADKVVTNKTQLSSVQDVDIAAMTLDLQAQELTYKSALAATAKTLQPSLMDYIS